MLHVLKFKDMLQAVHFEDVFAGCKKQGIIVDILILKKCRQVCIPDCNTHRVSSGKVGIHSRASAVIVLCELIVHHGILVKFEMVIPNLLFNGRW